MSGLLLFASPSLRGEKIWTNSASGFWSDSSNWSGHSPPDITSFIRITNDTSKTVTINALTASSNLTVQKLTLSAPPGATNTLWLDSVGLANPLIFQTGLELQDGAVIHLAGSGLQTLLTNDHVNIDGQLVLDSGWVDFGDTTVTARVGRVTSGTFAVNGGTVSAGTVTVGGLTNSSGCLNVQGGTFNIAAVLSVGRSAGTTGAVAIAGGSLSVPNDDTRVGDEGSGQMTVSNATAALNNLQVGRNAAGTLILGPGGTIQVLLDTVIGRFAGATGRVEVAGGQLLAGGQRIFVGRGGNGELDVSAGGVQAGSLLVAADTTNSVGATGTLNVTGGTVTAASNLWIGSASFSAGQIAVNGGSLLVTNAGSSAVLAVDSGNLNLSGGAIEADNLVLTNAAGQMAFVGGTLLTRSTTIANGVPFVVGDGTAPATLHLDGGTHTFAAGLIISSNATLEGCGVVLGSVVNHGTVATNCGGGAVPPLITTSPQAQTVVQGSNFTFTVTATGTPIPSYQWQLAGTNLPGAAGVSYGKASAQPADAGSYTVVVTNMAGSVTSTPALLTVLVPPSITTPPQAQTVVQGSNFSFTVTVMGTPVLSYQWQLAGTNLPGATGGSYGKSAAQIGDAGSYTVVVTNVAGSVTSAPVSLRVLAGVVLTFRSRIGTTNTLSFPSVVGSVYTLQFEDRLVGGTWTNLPPSTSGTGQEILVRDPTGAATSRFYRVLTL